MTIAKQFWFFTFKKGTINFGRYLKLFGYKDETMTEAIRRYGNDINFQYPREQFNCCNNDCWHLTELEQ